MKKYLIDASIIASSLENFKRTFINSDTCLLMTDLTFQELEARKKDYNCTPDAKKFTRFLIDLFVKNLSSTEVAVIGSTENPNSKHIDKELVCFAQANNISVLTCDKGMALWCRFLKVEYTLLEVKNISTLPFVVEDNGSLYLNLFDMSIPRGFSVFVYSPKTNKILTPLEDGTIFLNFENIILVAHSENGACSIDTYCVNYDMTLSIIDKSVYSSEEDFDVTEKPFHKSLFNKWSSYMKKLETK